MACRRSVGQIMLTMSAVLLTAILFSTSLVDGLSVRRDSGSEDDGAIRLPTNLDELFADVYNNNSVSLQLKAREPRFKNRTITEVRLLVHRCRCSVLSKVAFSYNLVIDK